MKSEHQNNKALPFVEKLIKPLHPKPENTITGFLEIHANPPHSLTEETKDGKTQYVCTYDGSMSPVVQETPTAPTP